MSSIEKIADENVENKSVPSTYVAANPLESFTDVNNASYRLHTSHNSTISNESDLSLLSLSLDKELEANFNGIDIDELPAFEIRLISPIGRTPSPIDCEDMGTPTRPIQSPQERLTPSSCRNNPDFVALHDINAQISPPSDLGDEDGSSLSRTSSLETIFEGVFLNTPPRQRLNLQNNRHNRSRTNLLEKVALNRFNAGKENMSPLSKSETPPSRRTSLSFNCETETCSSDVNHSLS
ncbi:uncharacterized protein LOC119599550 [Lucilia sericata]|uniref:uncharacterized protein LOC119599550 n=1 Tax=Lucilia sericata TaxID=13632 RepID=UPI0018A811A3|nr:uncharacterized protein LOC119599550 [Lucilia sericata]